MFQAQLNTKFHVRISLKKKCLLVTIYNIKAATIPWYEDHMQGYKGYLVSTVYIIWCTIYVPPPTKLTKYSTRIAMTYSKM